MKNDINDLDYNLEITRLARNYNNSIFSDFTNAVASSFDSKPRVLDFGAGIGTFSKKMLEFGLNDVSSVEISDDYRSLINEISGSKVYRTVNDAVAHGGKFDAVFTSNVLEHIEDDQSAINNIFESLTPGGLLFIYVPAFNFLFGEMDRAVGHFRRYEKADLVEKCKNSGFTEIKSSYRDPIGFFASILARRYSTVSKRSILIYDSIAFPISKMIGLFGLNQVIGKNICLCARRPIQNNNFNRIKNDQ